LIRVAVDLLLARSTELAGNTEDELRQSLLGKRKAVVKNRSEAEDAPRP
jgi:hypothetical protein